MTNNLEVVAQEDLVIRALYSMDITTALARTRVTLVVESTAPGLRLEDMQSDIDRVIAGVAREFTDQSCVMLHTDELEAECRAQLVNVLEKGWLTRAKNRGVFFKILKASLNNRMRSLVQQYRFTQKRTGIKPPPKHERFAPFTRLNDGPTKPNEISLDDEDAHLQVGEDERGIHENDMDTRQLVSEINARLAGVPQRVFQELTNPSEATFTIAWLDAYRGLQNLDRMKVRITHAHMCEGIQLLTKDDQPDLEAFEKAVLTIQQVTTRLREMNPDDTRYDALMAQLSETFNVQVPKNLSAMHVRRLFTIAARDNWQKVTPEIEEQLGEIGAVAPKFDKDSMRCHGVLYQRGHKICEACGVKVSCAAQAANMGLGEITIHPKLLGAKLRRTPYILPSPTSAPPMTTTERDQTIVDFLFGTFKKVTHQGELYFQPKDFSDKSKLIFCIGTGCIPLRLRFCKPNPLLKRRLIYVNKGYYAPDAATAEEVIEMINEHARFAYA